MGATTLFRSGPIRVDDYRCGASHDEPPFLERHHGYSLAYVRKGSFGYRTRGKSFELVTGSLLVGHPGDEYVCTHDHAVGDECLAVHFSEELVDSLGTGSSEWRGGGRPPLPGLGGRGGGAQRSARGGGGGGPGAPGPVRAGGSCCPASGAAAAPRAPAPATGAAPWTPQPGSSETRKTS